mgnify:CR=1 FL=1
MRYIYQSFILLGLLIFLLIVLISLRLSVVQTKLAEIATPQVKGILATKQTTRHDFVTVTPFDMVTPNGVVEVGVGVEVIRDPDVGSYIELPDGSFVVDSASIIALIPKEA